MLTISQTPYSRALPPDFIGLSLEYTTLRAYAGPNPRRINPLLIALIRDLAPAPSIRFGGDSTDWAWTPTPSIAEPPGIRLTITRDWLRTARGLAQATNARLILGVNFEANSRAVAATEARALTGALGTSRVAALELGNEPELYSSFGWYQTPAGESIPGRPPSWNGTSLDRDFARIGTALPRLPIAGPAIGGQQWIGYTTPFIDAERRLSVVTLHRYPLWRCHLPSSSPLYATLPHLLEPTASRGLADSVIRYARLAHIRNMPLRIDEINSVSCGGVRGISDTFASALWTLDTLFELARVGVDGVNFHTFAGAAYAPFSFTRRHRVWRASVKPEYYAMLMFNRADPAGASLLRIDGRTPNSVHAWATQSRNGTTQLVVINESARPRLITTKGPGNSSKAMLERLTAPGLRAGDGTKLAGQSFPAHTSTAQPTGPRMTSTIKPEDGVYAISLPGASAALLTLKR